MLLIWFLFLTRAPSIEKAVTEVYPSSHHGICRFHLENNIKARFKSDGFIELVRSAANAYTVLEFLEIFHSIKEFNQSLAKYLEDADFVKWARCYAPANRYNMMTTNIEESLYSMLNNPRELPIKALLETIRFTLTTWFLERRSIAKNHDKTVTPSVMKHFVEKYDEAMKLDVSQVNEDEFEVKKLNDMFFVNLAKKDCSCRVFNIDLIPCIHAIAAAKHIDRDVNDYVDEYHSTKIWAEAYSESIRPNGDEKNWSILESVAEMLCEPPSTRINRGRPTKKRKRSVGEYGVPGSKSQIHRCSRCSQVGHNKITCDVAI